jgi:heat shock protein beta
LESEDEVTTPRVEPDLGASREGSRTDDEAVQREEEAIKIDGLNVAQMKELRDKAEKFQFQVSFQLRTLSKCFDYVGCTLLT